MKETPTNIIPNNIINNIIPERPLSLIMNNNESWQNYVLAEEDPKNI